MSKKEKKRKKNAKVAVAKPSNNNEIREVLNLLAQKRTGGAINIRGLGFQILYASYLVLTRLNKKDQLTSIRLEGIEDVDIYLDGSNEFIQVKTSQNNIDAGTFWSMKILQNFYEAYKLDKNARFRLVHNTTFTKGKLEELGSGKFSEDMLNFWLEKFSAFNDISADELKGFFERIVFEKITESFLEYEIKKILFESFLVNHGTELTYIKAIFYNTYKWSKNKATITEKDVVDLFQSVKDAFSRFPTNPAIQNTWISTVSFDITEETDLSYYDGKAASPIDIAKGLPVSRSHWQNEIRQSFLEFDISVIKSSSGQGKSTLAWMTCFEMKEKGYSIYQLKHCSSYNEASAVRDFIESRLSIGQLPVIVIDGLNQNLSSWYELAEILREKPLRIIITTREEDWVRYGGDVSKVTLSITDIQLSMQEAQSIFNEFKKNKKLHPSVDTWEPLWELVKDKGLLIEYVYLLTQGEMIEERLKYQLKKINEESDSGAKIEILRLVSLADVLNLKIQTSKLTKHIRETIHLRNDRNELYKQLEKEYYLKFGERFVEGLHPVRSMHLVTILHSHTAVQESLLSLLKILDEEYIYDYFIRAPLQFDLDAEYYKKAAGLIALRAFPEMVYAIDGLMHFEPYQFWKQNKTIFDEVFQRGGLDLFVYDAIPFNKLNTLQSFSSILPEAMSCNIRYLTEQLTFLTPYSINNSIVFSFVTLLQKELAGKTDVASIEGVTFLYKWFKRIAVPFPEVIKIGEDQLIDFLEFKSISEAADLFHFYSISDPEAYKTFVDINRDMIIGWIKKKTSTLIIREEGRDIHINYLLDNDADKANEQSVYRINIVHSFLPFYEHYCTKGIILPFPNENIYDAVLNNSTKHLSPEKLGNDFDIHINQIWSKTILDHYCAASSFEWQKEHIDFRQKLIDLAKKCTYLFESHLEKKYTRVNSLAKEVVSLSEAYLKRDTTLKKYPVSSRKYFEGNSFRDEQNAITKCLFSFRNFVNQLSGLINPKNEQDRNLPLINLKSASFQVKTMQDAYEAIMSSSFKYFHTEILVKGEQLWLNRLSDTARFYDYQSRNSFSENIIVADRAIKEWRQVEEKGKLHQLTSIVNNYAEESPFVFYLPNKIIEEEILNYAVIGIGGCDISGDNNDLWDLSVGLREFATTDINYFHLLFVDNNKQVINSFTFNNDYFLKFKQFFETNQFDEDNKTTSLPLFPTEAMLATVEGITLKTIKPRKEDEDFYKMMFNIWKLGEYRTHLNVNNRIEKQWLDQSEVEFSNLIKDNMLNALKDPFTLPGRITIEKFLKKEISFSKDEIVQFMIDKSIEINNYINN